MGTIRRATRTDVAAIAELLREAYTPEAMRDGDPEVLQRVASHGAVGKAIDEEEVYVLEEGGRIVATATLQPLAYLRRIATLPGEQRRGHGEALLDHLVKVARREDYSAAGLDTDAKVPWLEDWYARRGFRTTGASEYLDSGFKTRYMEMKLKRSSTKD